MLKLTVLEFIFRGIPESFLIILAGYIINYRKINLEQYCAASIIYALAAYLIRMLPIAYGVHTILDIIVIILLLVKINKISVLRAISCSLIFMIILSICEWINVFILENLIKLNIEEVFKSRIDKILYSIPSMILFGLIILLFYIFIYRNKRGIENVSN